jgi:hypothetical protein
MIAPGRQSKSWSDNATDAPIFASIRRGNQIILGHSMTLAWTLMDDGFSLR